MSLDRHGFLMSLVAFGAISLAVVTFFLVGAPPSEAAPFDDLPGDAEAGRVALERLGCGACHTIDGVRRARGRVGPPLDNLRAQRMIAGRLPNTPDNLARFIMEPQTYSPGSAMPDLDVADAEARNMVAYLYGVRPRR